jgi:hypothetical protein
MNHLIDLFIRLNGLDWLTIVLSIYVIAESHNALCNMPEGYLMFCHKVKYILSFNLSIAFIYYAFMQLPRDMQWLIFGVSITLFFFVWPRMVFRFKKFFRELDEVIYS